MHTFALDGRFSDISRFSIARTIKDALIKGGMVYEEDHPDLVVCLGGDGSLLRSCNSRGYVGDFMLINGGTLGFLSDFKISEWDKAVYAILHSEPIYDVHRPLVIEDRLGHHAFAANDISLVAPVRTLNYEINVDGVKLVNAQGSGLVVSTALGSTAFSHSMDGPILFTADDVFALNLFAPVNNRINRAPFRHAVFRSNTILKIKIEQNFKIYRVGIDGIDTPQLASHELSIYMSKFKEFRILHFRDWNKYKVVADAFGQL